MTAQCCFNVETQTPQFNNLTPQMVFIQLTLEVLGFTNTSCALLLHICEVCSGQLMTAIRMGF